MTAARPILCLVVDRAATRHPLSAAVEAAFEQGADWLQIRERTLAGAPLLAWAQEVAEAAARGAKRAGGQALRIVNRRIDVALAIGADGAHLGFDALGVADARRLLGERSMLGVSAHSIGEVEAAARAGADYVHLAPVFDPLSKPAARSALGLAAVEAAGGCGIPVLAQGGVTADNAAELIRCGAAGLAVTGAILLADDPAQATRALRQALDAG